MRVSLHDDHMNFQEFGSDENDDGVFVDCNNDKWRLARSFREMTKSLSSFEVAAKF